MRRCSLALVMAILAGCDAGPVVVTASSTVPAAHWVEGAWRVTRYESRGLPLHHEVGMMAMWAVATMRLEVQGDGVRIDLGGAEHVDGRLVREGAGLRLMVDVRGMEWLSGALAPGESGGLELTSVHARLALAPERPGLAARFCVDAEELSLTRRDRCEPGEREQRLP